MNDGHMVWVDESHKITLQMHHLMSLMSPKGGKHSRAISGVYDAPETD